MKNYKVMTLFVTMMCNVKCSYCFQHHLKTKFNIKKLVPFNKAIYDRVCIMGGEPGLLSLNELNLLFNTLNIPQNKYILPTNGLFIEKYYEYFPNLNYSYHIVDIDNPKFYDIPNITNVIIATSYNLKNILSLLDNYPDKKFSINENFSERLLTNTKVNKDWIQILQRADVKINKLKENPEYICRDRQHLYDEI